MLLLSSIAGVARASVEAGPIVNPANGHSYYLLSPNSWAGAEAEATTLGGHLVTIENDAENSWAWTTFRAIAFGPFWIGLTDQASEGAFAWVAGEPVVYTNWWTANGEPNNAGGIEDYAELNNGLWNDNQGDAQLQSIAEVAVREPAGNLVSNPGFESPPVNTTLELASPSTVGPWVVEAGDVALVSEAEREPGEGSQSLELNGHAAGSIYQDLTTSPGTEYLLRFALAGDPGSEADKGVAVSWDGATVGEFHFDQARHDAAQMGYATEALLATATGPSTRLGFTSLNEPPIPSDPSCPEGSCYGPVIDAVSVGLLPPAQACASSELWMLIGETARCQSVTPLAIRAASRALRKGRVGLGENGRSLRALTGREDVWRIRGGDRAAISRVSKALAGATIALIDTGSDVGSRDASGDDVPLNVRGWTVDSKATSLIPSQDGTRPIGGSTTASLSKKVGNRELAMTANHKLWTQLEPCAAGAATRQGQSGWGMGQGFRVQQPAGPAEGLWQLDSHASFAAHLDPSSGTIATYDVTLTWSLRLSVPVVEAGVPITQPAQTFRGVWKLEDVPSNIESIDEILRASKFFGAWGPEGRLQADDEGTIKLANTGVIVLSMLTKQAGWEQQSHPCEPCSVNRGNPEDCPEPFEITIDSFTCEIEPCTCPRSEPGERFVFSGEGTARGPISTLVSVGLGAAFPGLVLTADSWSPAACVGPYADWLACAARSDVSQPELTTWSGQLQFLCVCGTVPDLPGVGALAFAGDPSDPTAVAATKVVTCSR